MLLICSDEYNQMAGNQSDEFDEEDDETEHAKAMRDQTWLQNYLIERMTPLLQTIEQELEVLKNKKPKTNAKKHRERSNIVT